MARSEYLTRNIHTKISQGKKIEEWEKELTGKLNTPEKYSHELIKNKVKYLS